MGPRTKADVAVREAYLAALLETLADQHVALTTKLDDLERHAATLEAPPKATKSKAAK